MKVACFYKSIQNSIIAAKEWEAIDFSIASFSI
ncbi:hypothetical protein AsAng_0044280 [Aureispira anguillae]|uniref:Uncharacterized protein n=1 Tax=Aureispira anguillae TaxID=2864201 RepID=A0A915YIM0_9BACT|nr:hypothetical protein AsAng_0044280 [Aureispira anguillae]